MLTQLHDFHGERSVRNRFVNQGEGWWQTHHPTQAQCMSAQGIDTSRIVACQPIGAPDSFAPTGDAVTETALWCGRPAWYKRFDLFLRACKLANVRPMLAGPCASNRESDMTPNAIRLPRQVAPYPDSYPAIYSRAGCYVTCSTTELHPLPLFEALACGCPVVSTRTGFAEDLPCAALLDTDCTDRQLADAIVSVLVHPPERVAVDVPRHSAWIAATWTALRGVAER